MSLSTQELAEIVGQDNQRVGARIFYKNTQVFAARLFPSQKALDEHIAETGGTIKHQQPITGTEACRMFLEFNEDLLVEPHDIALRQLYRQNPL